jgi:site-specific recombinase XerD
MLNDHALLEPFRVQLAALGLNPHTRACYVSAARQYLRRLGAGRDLEGLTVRDVRAYLDELEAQGLSKSSRVVVRAGLAQFLGFLLRRKASTPRLACAA